MVELMEKNARVQIGFRIDEALKRRFDAKLGAEGLDATDFLTAQIVRWLDGETKHETPGQSANHHNAVDIDPEVEALRRLRDSGATDRLRRIVREFDEAFGQGKLAKASRKRRKAG